MSVQLALGLLASLGIGVSLGLLGAGGSIVTVPVLIYVLGVEPQRAVGMSLAVVGLTSLAGALSHARRGGVRWNVAFWFALPGIAGAYLGSRLTYLVTPALLLVCFALLMTAAALRMLSASPQAAPPAARGPLRILAAGLLVGLLTGFLGVGGGFVIVPVLALFAGLSMREAVGTSLVIIAVNGMAGIAGHWSHGFDLRLTLLVSLLAVTGVILGAAWAHRVPAARLRRVFASALLLLAAFLLVRNLPLLPSFA